MKQYLKGWKFWAERARGYALWIQALLIIDIWLRTSSFFTWPIVIMLLVPITALIMYLDYKFVYPGEAESAFKANPEWLALRRDVDDIKALLNGIRNKEDSSSNKEPP